jgi:hypothetical protein
VESREAQGWPMLVVEGGDPAAAAEPAAEEARA